MSGRTAALAVGEQHDNYPGEVIRWEGQDGATRIVRSKCDLQWIVQRRIGLLAEKPRWRSDGFCRSRDGLVRLLKEHATEIKQKMPSRYEEAAA